MFAFLFSLRGKYPLGTLDQNNVLNTLYSVILDESGINTGVKLYLMMKGILFGLPALLLVFVIQAAMKCNATFCSDRSDTLQQDIRNHKSRCSDLDDEESSCCEAEKSSLEERMKNHLILCGGEFHV